MTRKQKEDLQFLQRVLIALLISIVIFQVVLIKRAEKNILWLSAELARERTQ